MWHSIPRKASQWNRPVDNYCRSSHRCRVKFAVRLEEHHTTKPVFLREIDFILRRLGVAERHEHRIRGIQSGRYGGIAMSACGFVEVTYDVSVAGIADT